MYYCSACSKEQKLSTSKIGFRECCDSCNADLHICTNCRHYDRSAYNQCKEPQADRVVEKERSNRCEYFEFKSGNSSSKDEKSSHLKKLDDLFK